MPTGIVDAHVHLWDPARLNYPWLTSVPALNRSFVPADFAAASAGVGVAKLVFVECGRDAAQSIAEADWVSELAKSEPRLKAILAHASLEKGRAAREELAALAKRPLVKGVRRLLQGEADTDFCLRPEFVAGVELLAEFGFTFDLCIRHEQLRAVTELVQRVPRVNFMLDHFGKPPIRTGVSEPWATELRALAALPNASCKLSGLTTEADLQNWKLADLRPYCDVVLDAFGFDRVVFGGDWPVATLATDYRRWAGTVSELLASATAAQRKKVFQTNAEKFYRT
ncbi:MAG: amidohydrolase [Pedosphaera sp.]|nr:amidohydrolase [Pedosphaera sp.]